MRISDWSSDVCSSDLSEVTGLALSPDGNRLYFNSERGMGIAGLPIGPGPGILYEVTGHFRGGTLAGAPPAAAAPTTRSEERRVGQECVSKCRSRGSRYH